MAELRYHIAIGRYEKRSLLNWVLRRPKTVRLEQAPCEQCGGTVADLKPNYVEGRSFSDTWMTWKEPDSLRSITLLPCRHEVDHYVYALEGNEHLLVEAILGYERGDWCR